MAKPYRVSTIGVSLDLRTADGETAPVDRGMMTDNQLKQLLGKVVVLVDEVEGFPEGFQLPSVKVDGQHGEFLFVASGVEEFECQETDDDHDVKGCMAIVRGESEILKKRELRRERRKDVFEAEQKRKSRLSYKIGVTLLLLFTLYYCYRWMVSGSTREALVADEMYVLALIAFPIVFWLRWREKRREKKQDDYLSGKTDKYDA